MEVKRAKEIVRLNPDLLPEKISIIKAGRILADECDKLKEDYVDAVKTIVELAREKTLLTKQLINFDKVAANFDELIRPEEGI
jgi:ABC-type uncharacterized transport system ATPase subunit